MVRLPHHDPDGRRRHGGARRLLALLFLLLAEPAAAQDTGWRPFVGYHETWSEARATRAEETLLARLPAYLNIVALSFVKPDARYGGAEDLAPTGLQTPFGRTLLAESIALLKQRHPGTRVLLSIGGATYNTWNDFRPVDIARLVAALGADGVDLDYEPEVPGCMVSAPGRAPVCLSDRIWRRLVADMRTALPRPYILSIAGWSVGAYGAGAFATAPPQGSRYTGYLLDLLRSPQAQALDLVNIMAYSAGPAFDPLQAFAAYRAVWPGWLALGLLVPPDTVVDSDITLERARAVARGVRADAHGGMMLYSLQRPAVPPGFGAQALGAAMCAELLAAPSCDDPF